MAQPVTRSSIPYGLHHDLRFLFFRDPTCVRQIWVSSWRSDKGRRGGFCGGFCQDQSQSHHWLFQQCLVHDDWIWAIPVSMAIPNLRTSPYLVGGLEHELYFSIYWEFHHPN